MSLIQAALEEIQFQQSEQWYQDFLRLQNTTKNTEMDTIIKHYNDIVVSRIKKKYEEMEVYAEFISKKLEEAETEINIEIRSHNNKQNRDIRQQILDVDKYLNIYPESIDSIQKHITKINTIRE